MPQQCRAHATHRGRVGMTGTRTFMRKPPPPGRFDDCSLPQGPAGARGRAPRPGPPAAPQAPSLPSAPRRRPREAPVRRHRAAPGPRRPPASLGPARPPVALRALRRPQVCAAVHRRARHFPVGCRPFAWASASSPCIPRGTEHGRRAPGFGCLPSGPGLCLSGINTFLIPSVLDSKILWFFQKKI